MKNVCAWCNQELPSTGDPDTSAISHGICPDCMDNIPFQMGVTIDHYLKSLKVPVLLMTEQATVAYANGTAQDLLGANQSELAGKAAGLAFECNLARLPEGCGNTIHCSGCTLRKAILDTFATGKDNVGVEATLRTGRRDVHYRISTHRVGEYVTLQIENIAASPAPAEDDRQQE